MLNILKTLARGPGIGVEILAAKKALARRAAARLQQIAR